MIEFFAGAISSVAVVTAILGIFWIKRSNRTLLSVQGIGATIIFAFSMWHWFHYADGVAGSDNEIIRGIFLLSMASLNLMTSVLRENKCGLSANRRGNDRRVDNVHIADDRRKQPRRSSAMKKAKLRTRKEL